MRALNQQTAILTLYSNYIMSEINFIGIGISRRINKISDDDYKFILKLFGEFPVIPNKNGIRKFSNPGDDEIIAIWNYRISACDEWNICDSLMEYLFVEKYNSLLYLCEHYNVVIYNNTFDVNVFMFGASYKGLLVSRCIRNRKYIMGAIRCSGTFTLEHNELEYINFLIKKIDEKYIAAINILKIMNENPDIISNLSSCCGIFIKQIFSLDRALAMNKEMVGKTEDGFAYQEKIKNIWYTTRHVAKKHKKSTKDTYMACWSVD